MYDKLSLLTLAKSRMDWVAKRQEVLSNNITNANTPNFVPSDLKPYDFKDALHQAVPSVQLASTNARHITPEITDPQKVIRSRKTFESSADGNAVVLEEQMAKVAEAKTAYETAASLFQKQYKMIKSALGKNF